MRSKDNKINISDEMIQLSLYYINQIFEKQGKSLEHFFMTSFNNKCFPNLIQKNLQNRLINEQLSYDRADLLSKTKLWQS